MIEIVDLHKVFERDGESVTVLRGVDLTIEQGESVSVMGRSGAGKSTLLQILGTLERPTSGKVMFDGVDVLALPDRKLSAFRGSRIGFVFQFHHLLPEFTSLENAAMPAIVAGERHGDALARAEAYLERVGLSHRLKHRPSELSGGEQQRVALARALVMQPRLLLADEPTGNLDAAIGEQIFDLLREINEELDISIVTVTHNPELAARMRRQLRVSDGLLHEVDDASAPLPGEGA